MGFLFSKKSKSKVNNQNIKKEAKPNNQTKTQKDEENISKYIKDKKELNDNNYYRVKDIENEYKKIENEIHQLCLDKNGDDDDEDGSIFEKFLENLKNISEKAIKISEKLKIALFKEFLKNNQIFKNLNLKKDNRVDEGCINEFSSWCKNNLKDEAQFVQDFCQKDNVENFANEDFDLLKKLTKIYLECGLCNEYIKFKKCKKECDFDNKEMFDLAEVRGAKKKVKYCVLPGLFYNGEFFQNGKIHVLAYSIKNQ